MCRAFCFYSVISNTGCSMTVIRFIYYYVQTAIPFPVHNKLIFLSRRSGPLDKFFPFFRIPRRGSSLVPICHKLISAGHQNASPSQPMATDDFFKPGHTLKRSIYRPAPAHAGPR